MNVCVCARACIFSDEGRKGGHRQVGVGEVKVSESQESCLIDILSPEPADTNTACGRPKAHKARSCLLLWWTCDPGLLQPAQPWVMLARIV